MGVYVNHAYCRLSHTPHVTSALVSEVTQLERPGGQDEVDVTKDKDTPPDRLLSAAPDRGGPP